MDIRYDLHLGYSWVLLGTLFLIRNILLFNWLQVDSRYPTSLHVLASRPWAMKEGVRMWLPMGGAQKALMKEVREGVSHCAINNI